MERLGLDFGAMLASIIEPQTEPKIERSKNQKFDSRVGGGSIFEGQGVSKIDEKSMPKRVQDKIVFEEAKNNENVSNIGPSWSPKSSKVASKIEVKNHSNLNGAKTTLRRAPAKKQPRVLTSQGLRPKAA